MSWGDRESDPLIYGACLPSRIEIGHPSKVPGTLLVWCVNLNSATCALPWTNTAAWRSASGFAACVF